MRAGPIYYGDPVERGHPLNRGLVSWWLPLPWYASGPRLIDIAGRNHGTLTNGPTWVTGLREYKALLLDGTDDYAVAPDASNLDSTGAFSIAVRLSITSLPSSGNFMSMVSKYDAGSNPGGFDFRLYNNSGTQSIGITTYNASIASGGGDAAYTLPTGQWIDLAAVYNRTDYRIYLDGSLILTIGTPVDPSANTKDLFIGSFGTYTPIGGANLGRYLSARVEGVRLYTDRSLSASDVALLADQSRRGYPDTLRRLTSRAWFLVGPPAGGAAAQPPVAAWTSNTNKIVSCGVI